MRHRIKAIIFDWGGVLIDNPVEAMVSFFVKKLGVEPDTLRQVYQTYMDDHMCGRIGEQELWRRMGLELKITIAQESPSLWQQAVMHAFKTKQTVLKLAQDYKDKGYKIALLSNTEPGAVNYYRQQVNFPMMDATVFSCEVGIAKPDTGIYTVALDRLAVMADEAVFIDDRIEFVRAAEKLGMHAIQFIDVHDLQIKLSLLTK